MNDPNSSQSTIEAPKRKCKCRGAAAVFITMLVLGIVVGACLRMSYNETIANSARQSAIAADRVNELAARVEKLEQGRAEAQPQPQPSAATNDNNEEIVGLKNEIQSLSAALSEVQSQLKQTAQNQANSKGIAAVIAFTQLRIVADRGDSFAAELKNLRQVTPDDAEMSGAIAMLEPVASTGAPDIASLRGSLSALVGQAEAAQRNAEATDWQSRAMAEVSRLISIRPLRSDAGLFSVIDRDLERHNLSEALAKADELPDASREVLKDWRAAAERRQNLDEAMNRLAERLQTVGIQ